MLVMVVFDILLTLNTKVYVHGALTSARDKILSHYISTMFITDLLTLIALSQGGYLSLLFVVRIVPLMRFVHRYKLEIVENQLYVAVIDLLIVLTRVLAIAHVFACCWYALGINEYR